jgi:phosphoribosylanthranilate isomerase
MTAVKICGMRSPGDLDRCRRADFLGFVVSTRSPRNLDLGTARELMSSCDNVKVAVTTETDRPSLERMVLRLEPDIIQLHVPLNEELLRFASGLGTKVWGMKHAVPGTTVEKDCLRHCQALVLDTPGERAGGNGTVHDWDLSREVRESVRPFPVVLAGGLRPENAAEAVRKVAPFAVDVSSGVESGAAKDQDKVNAFIDVIREVDRS